MNKKVVINCGTGKETIKSLTIADKAQRVKDKADGVKLKAKDEREVKISSEMRKMATDSLVAKNEIEPE